MGRGYDFWRRHTVSTSTMLRASRIGGIDRGVFQGYGGGTKVNLGL